MSQNEFSFQFKYNYAFSSLSSFHYRTFKFSKFSKPVSPKLACCLLPTVNS